MSRTMAVTLTVLLMAVGLVNADDMRDELNQAKDEIAALRAELAEMKENSAWQYQQDLARAMGDAPQARQENSGSLILPAGWSLKPYGYIKGDFIYNESRQINSNLCGWASPENQQNRSDDMISFTARQTRLGAVLNAPNIGDAQVKAVIETDFYGAGDENSAALRMRRAFGQIKGRDWLFQFGQDWEIISPLFPDTLNFMYGAYSGNLGFRYPQFRFDKWWTCNNESTWKVQMAVQREMPQDLDGFGIEDGRDASMPTFLGRIGYDSKPINFGISGHYGEEEIDWNYSGEDVDVHSWSLNADWSMPVVNDIQFSGEFFWGENLDCHTGYLNGVNAVATQDEIEVYGGWLQLGYKPKPAAGVVHSNVGYGLVDPVNGDINNTDMSRNQWYYGNVRYYFSPYLWTGVELSYFYTDYKSSDDGDLVRVQNSWVLQF